MLLWMLFLAPIVGHIMPQTGDDRHGPCGWYSHSSAAPSGCKPAYGVGRLKLYFLTILIDLAVAAVSGATTLAFVHTRCPLLSVVGGSWRLCADMRGGQYAPRKLPLWRSGRSAPVAVAKGEFFGHFVQHVARRTMPLQHLF